MMSAVSRGMEARAAALVLMPQRMLVEHRLHTVYGQRDIKGQSGTHVTHLEDIAE